MLNSWKKSTLPMPKRIQDLDLSFELEQPVVGTSRFVKPQTSGTKIIAKPMRTDEILKLFDFDPSPVVTRARKQLWSVSKSGSKKQNEKCKKTAIKENVRKTIFPKKSSRRTTTVKTSSAYQNSPLIDMEDLEKHPRKLNQPLRIPQSSVTSKTTMNSGAKRQTVYQTKLLVKPGTETRSTAVHNPVNTIGQSQLKRQTVHQSYALKSIPEISLTKCNDILDQSLPKTVNESEKESIHDMFKQILCRMDKLETMIQQNQRCCKCQCGISLCDPKTTKETAQENGNCRENNTVDFVENIAQSNNKIVDNIITDTAESMKQTSTEKVTDYTGTDAKNNMENIENIIQIVNKMPENVDSKHCVQNLIPKCTFNIEEVTKCDLNTEKPTTDNIHHKSHFELLEDQLQNDSLTSVAFIDSDECGSPMFQEIDYEYLLGENDSDLTEIHTATATTTRNNSTGSNDAIRTYNEMRKCIPMLCTPKISRNNASLMTPSVQNSHKKILSRRIQEQLVMLNKKS